ncbi:MAG: HNH endonuclease [Candidatus Baltobacteraceae bacterium]|jgi:putative restriction endonuclease
MKGFVAVTDPDWIDLLAATGAREANFWQPRPTTVRQPEGTPWIFKVRGTNRVAGFGLLEYWTTMPLSVAWETFGLANGVRSLTEMIDRVQQLRRDREPDSNVGCVALTSLTLLDRSDWISAPADWHSNIVRGAGYDLSAGEGSRVWNQLLALTDSRAELSALLEVPGGFTNPSLVAARRGQGAFRLMVIDAYDRRCAVTGERTLPVLEAAHIQPFIEHGRHEVRNGILMRSDLHKLYDRGLVTVEPDLTFRVSRTIDRDYSNGKVYYALEGKTIASPARAEARADKARLAWHASEVFRP